MTYTKPPELSYTDLAIWIDKNAYIEPLDETRLYEYLYHLAVMLAKEGRYFSSLEDYDQFGLYSASRLTMRLENKAQFTEPSSLPKIKSILNYLKTVIYPYKIDYQKEFCNPSDESLEFLYSDPVDLNACIQEEDIFLERFELESTLKQLPVMCRHYLSKIPYNKKTSEWSNIYISCLLTLLNNWTPSAQDLAEGIKNINEAGSIYKKLQENDPILYHLPDNMKDYIKVLVRQLQHVIAKELTIDLHTRVNSDDMVKNIIIATFDDED